MSIGSVQASVSRILSRIEEKTTAPSAAFQAILSEKLGVDGSKGSAAVGEAQKDAVTSESTFTWANTTTTGSSLVPSGRYCSECGMPEMVGAYSNYTAAVDAGDGMLQKAAPYMSLIEEASETYGVPVNLIMGVIKAESDYNPQCVSSAGAKGLMQIMPENAAEFGVTDMFDPRQNILCGVDEIARHLKTYGGDLRLALAAYNTGPGKIAARNVTSSNSLEYLTIPQSVRDYADRVLRYAGLE